MNERVEEALNTILDMLDNYDDTHYSISEIRDMTLKSTINETIEFLDIVNRDLNRIREIVNELLQEENDNG